MAYPDNLPKGSYFDDGVRAGPSYSGYYVPGGQPDPTAPNFTPARFVGANFEKWGKGILLSPEQTYRITPYISTTGNIVATQTNPGIGNLPLGGGLQASPNQATYPIMLNGQQAIQFDWPRGISVTVAVANAPAGGANITVFGNDVYGLPMQKTYALAGSATPGTYFTSFRSGSQKAFYQITRVALSAAFTGGATLSIQTNEIFGMPYKVRDWSTVSKFAWAGQDMRHQYGAATLVGGTISVNTPAVGRTGTNPGEAINPIYLSYLKGTATATIANTGVLLAGNVNSFKNFSIYSSSGADTAQVAWNIMEGGQNLFQFADTNVPSTTTGDVRGMFALPTTQPADGTAAGELWPVSGINYNAQYQIPTNTAANAAVITSYLFGSDTMQNQLASEGQPIGALNSGTTVPFLNEADLLGLPQFYSGVAS